MISSISLRGTSPQHTAVLWNGININSFSLGQADFSILPAVAFNDVKVHAGAGSARFGSGAFGGTVLLNSYSNHSPLAISLTQEAGSYGRYFSSVKISWNNGRWSFSSGGYNLVSKNNFKVLITDQPQSHASFRQSGFLQDVEYRLTSGKAISLHYWYHDSDRDVQPTIGQLNSQDNQQDRNHRVSLTYKSNGSYGLFTATSGYVNDVIVYDGDRSEIERWTSSVRHSFILKKIGVQVGADWNHIIGKIREYQGGHPQENRFDFMASFEKQLSDRISVALNLRQPVVTGFSAPFLIYIGSDYRVIKKESLVLKLNANVSKNYRVPTFNDRYWQNAGDPNLLPETSHSAEAGWSLQLKRLEFSNAWFAQSVDEWIQWVPGANGAFRPQNVQQVLAEGFDLRLNSRIRFGEVTIIPTISYQFTKSVTTQAPPSQQYVINKQLLYTPVHTGSGFLQINLKSYAADVSAQYSGKRYTEAGNSETYALPAFLLLNSSIGKYWLINRHRIDLRFTVKNILNLDYQLYSGRAMPGRNYNIQLNYQLQSKQKL
ncbi:TonB-dependent receptor [Cytophagales bacterium WSM2-2]|nr:TonB-dependent receptor [Cytophagales bacterium WSM2-2]